MIINDASIPFLQERGANTILAISEQTGVDFPDYSSTFKRGALMIQLYFDNKQTLKSFIVYLSYTEVSQYY